MTQTVREQARLLREKGLTFAEIRRDLGRDIPQGTLSYWFKGVQLPSHYSTKITKLNREHLSKARVLAVNANLVIRNSLLAQIEKEATIVVKNLSLPTYKIALAMLYLGEGAKWHGHSGLVLGSSEPNIIQLYIRLLDMCYKIPKDKLRARISYRSDQDINRLKRYWSKITKISLNHFYKTKPDPRTLGKKTLKAGYKGVCVISCAGAKIQLELEAITRILLGKLGP